MQALIYNFSMNSSQPVSQFAYNLNKRRDELGLEVKDVAEELQRRGIKVVYSTVASWFNGTRGKRWDVDELATLLDILQTDLKAMGGNSAELIEQPVPAMTAREMESLTPTQQQAILAMVRSMKGK